VQRRLLVLFAETPIHAGGSESTGVVDLPIQREAATGLPVVWGQSLKGALRDAARDAGWDLAEKERPVFGSRPPGQPDDDGDADDGSGEGKLVKGEVAFGDAQLLLFPAPTLTSTYAWVTSGQLMSRLTRKIALVAPDVAAPQPLPPPGSAAYVTSGWTGDQVVGPYVLGVQPRDAVEHLGAGLARLCCPTGDVFAYTRAKLATDLLYVADDVLSELASSGTDVVPRVQLDYGSKTVKNLFYSEQLPAETVLAALLTGPAAALDQLTGLLDGKPLQLGGDETIGKGLFWCRVHDAASLRDTLSGDGQTEREAG
jgi:CRISPR-associated protein Cmr4